MLREFHLSWQLIAMDGLGIMGYFDEFLGEWVDDSDHPVSEEFQEEPPVVFPHQLTPEERRRGGALGGKMAASRMTPQQRRARAQKAGRARRKS